MRVTVHPHEKGALIRRKGDGEEITVLAGVAYADVTVLEGGKRLRYSPEGKPAREITFYTRGGKVKIRARPAGQRLKPLRTHHHGETSK